MRLSLTRVATLLAVPSLALAAAAVAPLASSAAVDDDRAFSRVATYPVFLNVPDGVDPADETVAEISAVSEDGTTVVYTDAAGKRIGFVDVTDPSNPVGDGTLDLSELGDVEDEPTSVAVVGDYVMVVVNTSESYTDPSGRVDVVELASRERVASLDLGGQPDSIAVSPDGTYAAIAIENERDEDVLPDDAATDPDAEEGDLPQAPAGFVQTIDLTGTPDTWTATPVMLGADVIPMMDTPSDAELEYVDINEDDELVVSLQENNGVVVIDLPTLEVTSAFSAGEATLRGVDTEDDGVFSFTDTLTVPREPDAVHWVGDGYVATANEGDWKGGSRGWTVFDAATGEIAWDAGTGFEHLATAYGLFNDGRQDNKGSEPEGLTYAVYGGTPYAFVGSERSNFVAVYDMTDPTDPAFTQVLPTTNGPEGLLPVPGRDLFVVSSETDDAEAGVRATVGLYAFGEDAPTWPDVVSVPVDGAAHPIGWGALGALSADLADEDGLWTASDSAFSPARIYHLDTTDVPAVLDDVIEVRVGGGQPIDLDIEGLAARAEGGFWIASEGATGPQNRLVRINRHGLVQQRVHLPAEVAAGLGTWGLEGVAVTGSGDDETLYVALQRPLTGEDVARIGRYDVATRAWTWFGYPLETTDVEGDWIGLSEIVALDADSVAVIERDKQVGTAAAIKRVYTVDLPAGSVDAVTPVTKSLAVDVLPLMQARHGWTQEKLEGLTVSAGGEVYAVTDNDGLDDATGETQMFDLGTATDVFAEALATRTRVRAARKVVSGRTLAVRVHVSPSAQGVVRLKVGRKLLGTATLNDAGRAVLRVRLAGRGQRALRAIYPGTDTAVASSDTVTVQVVQRGRRS
ncbi:esterase-like activity of phytase family protein [Nocardioides bruguierae]|uniref:Esterase-like activity of phytase family protein n=1 Tax=Nocardioides bruguierae TaxID=2945102 RepID=A0A9X2D6A7_9ACTN|nr:esterase-like activity of phytase family protein [Nocardioides bruguierae]MCM0619983.1 esterase-like activity of phytase family protein [Nocardioides bruguierae]